MEQLTLLVVLVGDVGVGKTCIVERFIHNKVPTNIMPTVGHEFFQKVILTTQGQEIAVQIWDTGRPLRFANLQLVKKSIKL